MTTTNETRRKVMVLAWDLYRAELNGPNPRTFADALAGAWRFLKRMATWAAPAWARNANGVRFSPSLIQSPIQRTLRGRRYAGVLDRQAAYTTARLGY